MMHAKRWAQRSSVKANVDSHLAVIGWHDTHSVSWPLELRFPSRVISPRPEVLRRIMEMKMADHWRWGRRLPTPQDVGGRTHAFVVYKQRIPWSPRFTFLELRGKRVFSAVSGPFARALQFPRSYLRVF